MGWINRKYHCRMADHNGRWVYTRMDGPRITKFGMLLDYSGDRGEKYPPEGQKWLRLVIYKRGKEYRRYMGIDKKMSPEAVRAMAIRFRESIRLREGI